MSILSAQTIRERVWRAQNGGSIPKFGGKSGYEPKREWTLNIEPFSEAKQACGMSYGLSSCGYDIRLGKLQSPVKVCGAEPKELQSLLIRPGEFVLAASFERITLPNDLCGLVKDKSTLARQGIALQNTVLEPGWEGYITLEISNHGTKPYRLLCGQPIAQVLFMQLDTPTELPYKGKYQDQSSEPTEAILEN